MTKKQLEQQRDDLALTMIEADGQTYYDLQLEMDEIEENLYMMDCLGVEDMSETIGFDTIVDDFEDWSDLEV